MSKTSWRNRDLPTLDHIIGQVNPIIATFLTSHLVFEGLLVLYIEHKQPARKNVFQGTSFPDKVDICTDLGLFDTKFAAFLKAINITRNKFAHNLGFTLDKVDVCNLIKLAGDVDEIEFTDDIDTLPQDTIFEWYGDEDGALTEMFKHTAFALFFLLEGEGVPVSFF